MLYLWLFLPPFFSGSSEKKHDNNTCFPVIPISIFSPLRTRLSTPWGKIHSIISSSPGEEAWLHRNLYHNSIKRHCHTFENILIRSAVYTCSVLFVTFASSFFRRLFWKKAWQQYLLPCDSDIHFLSVANSSLHSLRKDTFNYFFISRRRGVVT